jgi:hypothetical protein
MSGSLSIRTRLMHPEVINRRSKFRKKRQDDHVRARLFSSSPMSARSKPPKLDLAAPASCARSAARSSLGGLERADMGEEEKGRART